MKSVDFMVTSTLSTAALGLIIVIKDASGQVLNLDATVSAKISADQDEDALNPGKIIQQWENVPLDKKEFLTAMGTAVNLPYNNFAPAENGQSGYINVTATVNGFSLNSVVKYLPFYEPCDCEEH